MTRSHAAPPLEEGTTAYSTASRFTVPVGDDSPISHRALGLDERAYIYSTGAGSFWVIVRKVGRHWVIRETYRHAEV